MIHIEDKCKCVGCYGCVSTCPLQCIEMKSDVEGFLYPVVDLERCIDCGLCENACSVLHQGDVRC